MDTRIAEDQSPKSSDLEGWRRAIADDRLRSFRLEAIAAAFQDLGPLDTGVRNALAKHLSDSILRILRNRVGYNHPNKGEDIILRIHGEIFVALLRPTSADGRNLREAFVPRVLFRMKDAIAKEERQRRIPDETKPKEYGKTKKVKGSPDAGEVEIGALAETRDSAGELGAAVDGEIVPHKSRHISPLDGVRDTNEQIDVDRILECIPDGRKRLAFRLFMDDVPYQSKRKDVTSIALALGISEKTARDWIKEVQQLLERNDNVKELKRLRLGDTP